MGIMPADTEHGVNCNLCFVPGHTPRVWKVHVYGVKYGDLWNPACGFAPNGYHDMVQDPFDPCNWWVYLDAFRLVYLRYDGAGTAFSITWTGVFYSFLYNSAVQCEHYFVNSYTNPALTVFYGGWAFVINPKGIYDQIEAFTPVIDPDPRSDVFPMADEEVVFKYCGKRDSTNIKIKVDIS